MAVTFGDVPLLDPVTGKFPSAFDSPTVAINADRAEAAAADAAAIRDDVELVAGLTGEDGAVAYLVRDAGSDTGTALADTIGVTRKAPGGTLTTGPVMLYGEHAYAHVGIATAAVAGGAINYENIIGGNLTNVNTPSSLLTGKPTLTGQNGNWVFIHGGYDNAINGWACSVMGFHCKVHPGANHGTISGGSIHEIQADASYGTIAGGTGHTLLASSAGASIGGGRTNQATMQDSTVSGGQLNKALHNSTSIGGGLGNTSSQQSATVGGGYYNTASGVSSTISGGQTNTASGEGAAVTGGRDNTAAGNYSRTGGRGAVASNAGEDVFASSGFTVPGDAQAVRVVLKRETADATPSDLQGPAALPPVVPENTTWVFRALVVARRSHVDGENAAWEVRGLIKRDAGNTTALVGTPSVVSIGASAGNVWSLTVANYSVGHLRLVATGEAGKTIRWVASLESVQVARLV